MDVLFKIQLERNLTFILENENSFAPTYTFKVISLRNQIVSNYRTQQNRFQDQILSWRIFSLNNDAQNGQSFFQIIFGRHISNTFLPEDCADLSTIKYK